MPTHREGPQYVEMADLCQRLVDVSSRCVFSQKERLSCDPWRSETCFIPSLLFLFDLFSQRQ